MSQAFPDDATVASRGLEMGLSRRLSSGQLSRRLSLAIIGGLSMAGWFAMVAALHQLVG